MGEPIVATKDGRILTIYVSAHCSGCARAVALSRRVQAILPEWTVNVVDVDGALLSVDSAPLPRYVVGTPVYVVNEQVISFGNPAESDLILRLNRMRV